MKKVLKIKMSNENVQSSIVHVQSSMKSPGSERKLLLIINLLLDLDLLWFFSHKVDCVTLYVYGFRVGGAGVFAGAATHADAVVNFRDIQLFFVRNHMDGLCGAMLGAGAADGVFCVNDTILFNKIRFA